MTTMHRLRLARGQSLRQLAAAIGSLSYETVRRVELGRTNVGARTRYAIEQHFGLPLETLAAPLTAPGSMNAATPEGSGAEVPDPPVTKPEAS